jgi:NitT/TauT family transport system permease protein
VPAEYLPSPLVVAATIGGNLLDPETYTHVLVSLRRTFGGFALALVGGTALGIAMGVSRRTACLLDLWVAVGLSIPSLCWAYVALMFFGLSEAGVYVAVFLIVVPFVVVNVWQGVRSLDPMLGQMARVFHLSDRAIVWHTILPQLVPFVFGATRYGLGLAWKATAVSELVSQQDGVGYVFARWFGLFEMSQVLAWTVTFVVLMLATELCLVRTLERRLTAWRGEVRL